MFDFNALSLWRKFLGLPNDNLFKTLIVAIMVAFISAVIVSVTAVTLKPLHEANLEQRRQARMEEMIAALPGISDLMLVTLGDELEVSIVDLSSAKFAFNINPANYDQRAATKNPRQSIALPPKEDIAGLGRRANFAPVYMLHRDGELALLVLPVNGLGFQSMLYGYLALEGDLTTIAGLTFYEHAETPGLGARIEEPSWEALWSGREIAGPDGAIQIEVVRGVASAPYQVDGISGATRTGNGVTNLLHFWLGDNGFGPFLAWLKAGEPDND